MPLPVAQRRDFDGQARGSHSGLEELDQRQEPLDATELGYSDSNHEEGDAREWEDVDEEVEELPVPGEKQSGHSRHRQDLAHSCHHPRLETPVPDEHLRFRPPTKTSAPFTFAANETGEQKLRCILRGINAAPSTIHKATGKPKVKVSKRTKTLTGNEDAFVALYDEFGDLEIFEKLNTRQELPKLSRQPRELSQCSYPVNYLALNKLRHRRRASRLLRGE